MGVDGYSDPRSGTACPTRRRTPATSPRCCRIPPSAATTRSASSRAPRPRARASSGPSPTPPPICSATTPSCSTCRGHGTLTIDPLEGTRLYFLPSDSTLEQAEETGIGVDWLEAQVGAVAAKRRVLILDTCHNGRSKSGLNQATRDALRSMRGDPPPPNLVSEVSESEARLYAAQYYQPAMEDPNLGNGGLHPLPAAGAHGQARLRRPQPRRPDRRRRGPRVRERRHDHPHRRLPDAARRVRRRRPRRDLPRRLCESPPEGRERADHRVRRPARQRAPVHRRQAARRVPGSGARRAWAAPRRDQDRRRPDRAREDGDRARWRLPPGRGLGGRAPLRLDGARWVPTPGRARGPSCTRRSAASCRWAGRRAPADCSHRRSTPAQAADTAPPSTAATSRPCPAWPPQAAPSASGCTIAWLSDPSSRCSRRGARSASSRSCAPRLS